jgi:hypothetical protein
MRRFRVAVGIAATPGPQPGSGGAYHGSFRRLQSPGWPRSAADLQVVCSAGPCRFPGFSSPLALWSTPRLRRRQSCPEQLTDCRRPIADPASECPRIDLFLFDFSLCERCLALRPGSHDQAFERRQNLGPIQLSKKSVGWPSLVNTGPSSTRLTGSVSSIVPTFEFYGPEWTSC